MLTRDLRDGLHVVRLEHGGMTEMFLTAVPARGDGLEAMFARAMASVREVGATVCRQDVFGTRGGAARRNAC